MRFFSFFVANKIFQSFFTKRDFIGYCYFILLRSIFFIEIGSSFWWNIFFFQFQYHEVLYFLLLLYVLSKIYFFFLCFRKWKDFYLMPKKLLFCVFRVFHFFVFSFLFIFISYCFHFFLFLVIIVFISSCFHFS